MCHVPAKSIFLVNFVKIRYGITRLQPRKNLVTPILDPFWSKFAPFFAQDQHFRLFLQNDLLNSRRIFTHNEVRPLFSSVVIKVSQVNKHKTHMGQLHANTMFLLIIYKGYSISNFHKVHQKNRFC